MTRINQSRALCYRPRCRLTPQARADRIVCHASTALVMSACAHADMCVVHREVALTPQNLLMLAGYSPRCRRERASEPGRMCVMIRVACAVRVQRMRIVEAPSRARLFELVAWYVCRAQPSYVELDWPAAVFVAGGCL